MSASRLLSSALLMITLVSRAVSASGVDALALRDLPVTVCDFAGVDQAMLETAETMVGDIYARAGVAIQWAEGGCLAGPPGLYVNLVSAGLVNVKLAEIMLGFAESGGLTATVLYDRVERMAGKRRRRREQLLAYVMAHEIGHLLLPPNSHSASGIMQPTVNLHSGPEALRQSFTPSQANVISHRTEGTSIALATH